MSDASSDRLERPAGFGARLLATLVDFLCFGVIEVLLSIATSGSQVTTTTASGVHTASANFFLSGPVGIVFALAILGYYIVMETYFGGTLGKLVLGLRVVSVDGRPVGWRAASIRTVLRVVDGFPYLLPYLVGAILIGTSRTHERLGDRIAKTVVVRAAHLSVRTAEG